MQPVGFVCLYSIYIHICTGIIIIITKIIYCISHLWEARIQKLKQFSDFTRCFNSIKLSTQHFFLRDSDGIVSL